MLNCHIGRIVLGSMCVGVSVWLGWSGIRIPRWSTVSACNCNTHRTKNNTTNVVIQQNSGKLLMMDILMSETCWAHKKWNKIASDIKLVFYSSTKLIHASTSNSLLAHFGILSYANRRGIVMFFFFSSFVTISFTWCFNGIITKRVVGEYRRY